MMKRHFLSNLSPEDLRAYRRWTRGLYLSYFVVVTVALGLTFVNRPAEDMKASKDAQFAFSKQNCQWQRFEPARCKSVTCDLRLCGKCAVCKEVEEKDFLWLG